MTKPKTVNSLIEEIIKRIRDLANLKIDDLRSCYPESTNTRGQLLRYCRESGLNRGEIIEAIILDEFYLEFDREIEQ